MLEHIQEYIKILEDAVLLSNERVINLIWVIENKDLMIYWLIILNLLQPCFVLIITFWGSIMDFYDLGKEKLQNYLKKGGKNGQK